MRKIICSCCGRDINAIGQDNMSHNSNPICEDCSIEKICNTKQWVDTPQELVDKTKEPRDLELEVYEELCVGCSDEKICHEECEYCVQFEERLKEKENEKEN